MLFSNPFDLFMLLTAVCLGMALILRLGNPMFLPLNIALHGLLNADTDSGLQFLSIDHHWWFLAVLVASGVLIIVPMFVRSWRSGYTVLEQFYWSEALRSWRKCVSVLAILGFWQALVPMILAFISPNLAEMVFSLAGTSFEVAWTHGLDIMVLVGFLLYTSIRLFQSRILMWLLLRVEEKDADLIKLTLRSEGKK